MSHPDDSPQQPRETAPADDRDAGAERPDLRGPRGNQDVDATDVERGQANLERVLGW